jgi:uncharacterized protein YkwD
MTKRGLLLRVALLALAALLPASLLTSPAAAVPTPEAVYASQARKAANAERTSRDLPKFSKSACLQKAAVAQAKRMASRGLIFHQPLGPILGRCGLQTVGENVAYGFPSGTAVIAGWMNSPQHRANILNRGYRQMGLAARKDGDVWYVAQVFGRAL